MNQEEISKILQQYEDYDLDEQDKEVVVKVIKNLHLHEGDTIEVHDYDDTDLMDFIEERGSNEFIVEGFDYYDGTVWVEDCEYGIDMQYIGNLTEEKELS